MKIGQDTVEYIARLARLSLTEEERRELTGQLEDILGHMSCLSRLDSGEGADSGLFGLENITREDRVFPSANREELLRNAPAAEDGMFVVPRTVE